MSANNDGLTVEEAAEKLRSIKSSAGDDALREFFQTGGGLLGFEGNDLVAAVNVVGRQRAQQILEVDVPSEIPGEQAALPGQERFPDQPRERAEPTPEGTASLAEFRRRADEVDQQIADREASERRAEEIREEELISVEDVEEGFQERPGLDFECMDRQNAIEAILNSARRQGFLNVNEFDQSVAAAEDAGCVSSADATRLRDTAQSAAPEPSAQEFDQLLEDVQTAFAGGQGNG